MSDDAPPEFDLHELMDEYGLGAVRSVCKAKGGEVNENWIVRTAMQTVVVRGVAKEWSHSDIQFEHSFIKALGRDGFPYHLPQPLRTRMGRTVVVKNGTYVWLYNYIAGSSSRPSRPSREEVIAQTAHAMATAHKAARRFSLRQVKKTPIALEDLWLVHTLRRWQLKLAGSLDERCRFFRARVQECIGILEQLRCTHYHALPRLPIHGDICLANLVFSGGRLTGIIDFDHCSLDTAIRDITIALRYECTDRKHCFKLDLQAARNFLRVYHEVNPLSREEIDLIPAVAMADSADLFWWRIFQVAGKRTDAASMHGVEQPFKALQWYNRHQADVARALRI
jgi:Ser/Thr protein kinase RdoA (MazF antagonist)